MSYNVIVVDSCHTFTIMNLNDTPVPIEQIVISFIILMVNL